MSVINRDDPSTEARIRRGQDMKQFHTARRALLEAWVAALPHLSAADALEEEQGTASAMTQLRKLRTDGGEWR